MINLLKNLSIFKEARIFHLKIWQTPSFLFILMGLATIITTYITFIIASRFDNLEAMVISVTGVTLVVFIIGVLLVKVISKIIIINNARTEFLSIVTHQLRSPLTGSKYIYELILKDKVGPLTNQLRELLTQGAETTEKMLLLVSDLLDIAKMAEGDSPFNFEKVQIENLIKEIHKDLTANAEAKKIKLNLHLPKKLPIIKLDQKKIKFVIQNLIDNAVKYTPANGTVTINAESMNKFIQISIKDSGIGIPEDEKEKLFTKFFRASNAEKIKQSGTGLGLYIAKNVIERHGGEIWFESKQNFGTTFFFKLPLKPKSY